MADLEYRKLSDAEVDAAVAGLTGWKAAGGKLSREFRFDTYKDGIVFAAAVGFLADRLNHHPDLTIGYGRVMISMNTHDVGGLSPYDFELARRIDAL